MDSAPMSDIETASSASSDTAGVGLSDPQDASSQRRRRMLDLVNRLHSTGVQTEIDLPMIAVIGNQSAGKSSLIESISGITLPRASGTCTRCPTECRLAYSTQPWQCSITLRFMNNERGEPLGQVKNVPFGPTIFNKAEVEERLRRAQRAILNPAKEARIYLDGADEDADDSQVSFSKNSICLQISGKDLADLSFVDLPGLIVSVRATGSDSDIKLVENLVESYIKSPSCLILLTVTCETDFENQGAYSMAKLHDPEGKRTIGVLTKPDKIDSGDEDHWLSFIRNDSEPLVNGWYAVKQPNTESLKAGISWKEARVKEDLFFSTQYPWSDLEAEYQKHLRTSNLVPQLSTTLSDLIAKSLPKIREELQKGLQKTDASLLALPLPPSSEPVAEIYTLLSTFSGDIAHEIAGTPDEYGLIQAIRPLHEKFRRDIRATVPRFVPYSKKEAASRERSLQDPAFLEAEEGRVEVPPNDGTEIFIDDVMRRASQAVSREFPDHCPFVVTHHYVRGFTSKWQQPVDEFLEEVDTIITEHAKAIVKRHFSQYQYGGLQSVVNTIVCEHIQKCLEETRQKLMWLLELEDPPLTLNNHYYTDYKDKFLTYYRSIANKKNSALADQLQKWTAPKTGFVTDTFQDGVAQMLGAAPKIGFDGLKATDLVRLLPINAEERAFKIMAEVRAYYQVAYKRFIDIVPLAVDHGLVRGLERGLQKVLFDGLGVGGPEGFKNCKMLLQEPPLTATRREELSKRRERLLLAKKELIELRL
ncbi:hypothetical protein PUNSTDRAFT_115166 [Punctularia strigosozonata HHB-11173 SS5]|uniref:uncharacterized protein n=1 Tax=Punctularia strigosozonata (strain HHB-11173) TaxID=741275 RepID=UPI000441715C|nr:uncharacterized protein PUNSTDRAFT_115166 [Punctularia strigosozonata HHB-11173 SS5]EIN06635.1 hypothetical protein PUNSTDRAFT_115166 [Punctularia strigosozonata HHB-11173 SS5]